jgi:hypothetical protein
MGTMVTWLMSCFLDTGLGNLWEFPMEGSHSLKRGPLNLLSTTEELLEEKRSGSDLEKPRLRQ